jgi:hypothetical protein
MSDNPHINSLKSGEVRNYLRGEQGVQINALMAATAWNPKK